MVASTFFAGLNIEKPETTINANLVHYKELIITGTTGQTIDDFRKALDLITRGKVKVQKLITDRYSLDDAEEAFAFANSKKGLKTMIFPMGLMCKDA